MTCEREKKNDIGLNGLNGITIKLMKMANFLTMSESPAEFLIYQLKP